MTVRGDKDVDALYDAMRRSHGGGRAQANGYRSHAFFERERRLLLARVDRRAGPVLDIACGSGLMVAPLRADGMHVVGLDFNADACADARANGVPVVRGDAFGLPFADATFGTVVNCQFLNQQPADRTRAFVTEAARVLRPGGRLLIQWRHARSWLHRGVHAALQTADRFTGAQAQFPQHENPLAAVTADARAAGMAADRAVVTLPAGPVDHVAADGLAAGLVGASLFAEFVKR